MSYQYSNLIQGDRTDRSQFWIVVIILDSEWNLEIQSSQFRTAHNHVLIHCGIITQRFILSQIRARKSLPGCLKQMTRTRWTGSPSDWVGMLENRLNTEWYCFPRRFLSSGWWVWELLLLNRAPSHRKRSPSYSLIDERRLTNVRFGKSHISSLTRHGDVL